MLAYKKSRIARVQTLRPTLVIGLILYPGSIKGIHQP